MTPENVVLQLKKNGTFDDLRKRLLSDFQAGEGGQQFLEQIKTFMQDMITKDPSLLEKDSSFFYEQVNFELEKAGVYKTLRQHALDRLNQEHYQNRVDQEIKTVTEKNA